MKHHIVILVSLMSTPTWAAGSCTPNDMQVNVCQAATAISDSIEPMLPVRLTQSLVLHHIESSENTIRMSAFFDYTEAFLQKRLRTGVSLDELKEGIHDMANVMACRPETELEAFVNLGGRLEMVYLFSDAAHFLTVDVEQCADRPKGQ